MPISVAVLAQRPFLACGLILKGHLLAHLLVLRCFGRAGLVPACRQRRLAAFEQSVSPLVVEREPITRQCVAEVDSAEQPAPGADAPAVLTAAASDELDPIAGSPALWAELRWAARAEGVVHLDDILLRRVRLGLLLPEGGTQLMPRIRAIAQPELNWDDERWTHEVQAYSHLWKTCCYLPAPI